MIAMVGAISGLGIQLAEKERRAIEEARKKHYNSPINIVNRMGQPLKNKHIPP